MNGTYSDSEDDIDIFLEKSLRLLEDRDSGLDISSKVEKLKIPWRCPQHIRQIYEDLQKLIKSDVLKKNASRTTKHIKQNPVIKVECCNRMEDYRHGVTRSDFVYLGITLIFTLIVYFTVGRIYHTSTPIY